MNYDDLIDKSIQTAVADADQSGELADLLVRLFREIASGNESLDDRDTCLRRSEILYSATDRGSEPDGPIE